MWQPITCATNRISNLPSLPSSDQLSFLAWQWYIICGEFGRWPKLIFLFQALRRKLPRGYFFYSPAWSHQLQRKLPMSLCSDFYIKECRANIHHELHGSKKLQKVFPLCSDFYIEGQRAVGSRWQEVMLAGFAWVIDSCWYLCETIWKTFRKSFPKSSILDIRWWLTCWKNFLEVVSICPIFPM